MDTPCVLMVFHLAQGFVFAGSHNLTGLATYIREERAFSATVMLDDITVAYYNSGKKIYVARGNDTNEDDVIDPRDLKVLSEYVLAHFEERSNRLRPVNATESLVVYQMMAVCTQSDNKHQQLFSKTAYRGSTVDERCFIDGDLNYQLFSNYTEEQIIPNLSRYKLRVEKLYYPVCITTLKNYLKKRETQLNRKEKPRVRLIRKAISDSGGSRVSCLATGFYPRHINLTLFRDQQPVADHEITGGDLLPNDDGTYQMRKSLEISAADKHKYTCSVTHLSLDNKLDVTLESEPGVAFKSAILSVLIFLSLVLVCGTGLIIYKCRKRQTASNEQVESTA
ncbi:major histocompatibility complex class I-related gene protein-like [Puntigrus tetrazona]|uniref:major histocompatibility complex class I-related gene protein-like n=1 Tax=Puntigrus tetrazona TaxID=1606681 RepID=UPI001C894242|nr:major histocompatibility complex class I-related gene protein-like [Puntigrus tetrazona]